MWGIVQESSSGTRRFVGATALCGTAMGAALQSLRERHGRWFKIWRNLCGRNSTEDDYIATWIELAVQRMCFTFFPECVARVPVSFWGPGVEGVLFARRCVTARSRSQPFATVRNRLREGRMAVPVVSSAEGVILEVSNVALLRFAWQAWHFVTFRRVL